MRISRKIFLYTFLTTLFIGTLIITYFSILLPGLYSDYKIGQYFDHMQASQETIMANNSCLQSSKITAMTSISFDIPAEGYTIGICNTYFKANAHLKEETLQSLLDELRQHSRDLEQISSYEEIFDTFDFSKLEDLFNSLKTENIIQFKDVESFSNFVKNGSKTQDYQIHRSFVIMSAEVHDNQNTYVTFIAFGERDHHLYFTLGSAMSPKLEELSAIISTSLPMIIMLLLFFSMLFARFFTRHIALPIETLASQAKQWKSQKMVVFKQPNQHDEFKVLENSLNHMQEDINSANLQLKQSHEQLKAEQQRKEIFMMNASHHLKTPLASASLLTESMIRKIGKFSDHEVYLPKVREELRRMQELLGSMLNAFRQDRSTLHFETFDIKVLIENIMSRYDAKILQKNLKIKAQIESLFIESDIEIMSAIIDNFFSNAVKYTPQNQTIIIKLEANTLSLLSTQSKISPELLIQIKDPFVRDSNHQESGTGLGLYLVDIFTRLLGYVWTIENTEEGVLVTLSIKERI